MTLWRPITGYEGRYEISDGGQVKALAAPGRGRLNADRILKIRKGTRGYWQVLLYDGTGRKPRNRRVHQLVLEEFSGPRPEGACGRHIDDNPDNNHISNLRWGTQSDNTHDMVRNGIHNNARKTNCKHGHPLSADNLIASERQRVCRTCAERRQAVYVADTTTPNTPGF